jgi:putative transposase
MARKGRIEYGGAQYHVISRGNYRKDLFLEEKTALAFEAALFEAAERCGWKLFAYVIMSNHYHLALETPEANLVAGMQWLQSSFATRFNRYHNERGHVFQGRYKALLLNEDRSLLGLVNYIHLNPVRAGLCTVEGLNGYALSSFPKYFRRKVEEPLQRKALLTLCDLPDTVLGMRRYQERLKCVEEADPALREKLHQRYCRGWFLGSAQAKKELSEELVQSHPGIEWEGTELKELNQERWERIVIEELAREQVSEADLARSPKGMEWKVRIASRLRKETTAKNPWIANRLCMGHPNYVSNLLNR